MSLFNDALFDALFEARLERRLIERGANVATAHRKAHAFMRFASGVTVLSADCGDSASHKCREHQPGAEPCACTKNTRGLSSDVTGFGVEPGTVRPPMSSPSQCPGLPPGLHPSARGHGRGTKSAAPMTIEKK